MQIQERTSLKQYTSVSCPILFGDRTKNSQHSNDSSNAIVFVVMIKLEMTKSNLDLAATQTW